MSLEQLKKEELVKLLREAQQELKEIKAAQAAALTDSAEANGNTVVEQKEPKYTGISLIRRGQTVTFLKLKFDLEGNFKIASSTEYNKDYKAFFEADKELANLDKQEF